MSSDSVKQLSLHRKVREARAVRVRNLLSLVFDGVSKPSKPRQFKTESPSSTWKFDVSYTVAGQPVSYTLFVKANDAGTNPQRFRTQVLEARHTASLHSFCTPRYFGIYTILGEDDIGHGPSLPNKAEDEGIKTRSQVLDDHIFYLREGIILEKELGANTIVAEVTEFIHGLTIAEILEDARLSGKFTDSLKGTLIDLRETFRRIHREPEDSEIGISPDDEHRLDKRLDLYNRSLDTIQDRLYDYLPPHPGHPFLKPEEISRLAAAGSTLRQRWWGHGERLVHCHGDAQAKNCLCATNNRPPIKDGQIFILDWGRLTLTDLYADWGRFIGDLLWRHIMHGDPRTGFFPQIIEFLLKKCETMYEDSEFRSGILLGIFVLAAIRLSKRELVGIDLMRARKFYDLVMSFSEKGRFEL